MGAFWNSISDTLPAAVKTGTTTDYRDNWTVGYTPEFTVAVWVGNPDGSRMRGITGVTGAAPVMHEIFEHLHEHHGTTWFDRPARIERRILHQDMTKSSRHPAQPGQIQEPA